MVYDDEVLSLLLANGYDINKVGGYASVYVFVRGELAVRVVQYTVQKQYWVTEDSVVSSRAI